MQLNIEAEKDRPSPLLSSSTGFTGNLSAVLLSLCQPIVSDHSKLKKVDWRFLTAQTPTSSLLLPGRDTDIFPRDCTRLTPSGVFPPHAAHTEDEDPSPTEFNFITLVRNIYTQHSIAQKTQCIAIDLHDCFIHQVITVILIVLLLVFLHVLAVFTSGTRTAVRKISQCEPFPISLLRWA